MIRVRENLPGCKGTPSAITEWRADDRVSDTRYTIRTNSGTLEYREPVLDLASSDIVNYRTGTLAKQGIRYANPVRSVRIRERATTASDTEAYLMKNDPVVVTGEGAGWTPVAGGEVEVTDTTENTIAINTQGRAKGFTRTKYLRDPNPSDLVRIGQADQAYWSDVAHVKVAHLVNVRVHPWYGAKIVTSLKNGTQLYVISTVDNWSEVMSDDGSVRGYIKSEFLVIEKSQRKETPGVR